MEHLMGCESGPHTGTEDWQVFRSAAKHRQEDTKWKSEASQTEEKRTSEVPEQDSETGTMDAKFGYCGLKCRTMKSTQLIGYYTLRISNIVVLFGSSTTYHLATEQLRSSLIIPSPFSLVPNVLIMTCSQCGLISIPRSSSWYIVHTYSTKIVNDARS